MARFRGRSGGGGARLVRDTAVVVTVPFRRTAADLTASRSLIEADTNLRLEVPDGTSLTYTIQPQATQAIPNDSEVEVVNLGEGTTTIQAASGVTLNTKDGGEVKLNAYDRAFVRHRTGDEWVLYRQYAEHIL